MSVEGAYGQLDEIYAEFEVARNAGDKARMDQLADAGKAIEASIAENTTIMDRADMRQRLAAEVNDIGGIERFVGGAKVAGKNALRSVKQLGGSMIGMSEEELQKMGSADTEEERLREALLTSSNAGAAGEFTALALPAALGGWKVAAATKGLPLTQRLGAQAMLGATENTIASPSRSGDFWKDKRSAAALGAAVGPLGELVGPTVSGLRRTAAQLGGGKAPRSTDLLATKYRTATPEESYLESRGFDLTDAHRVSMRSDGRERAGMRALEEGRRLQKSDLQEDVLDMDASHIDRINQTMNERFGGLADPNASGRASDAIDRAYNRAKQQADEAWSVSNENLDIPVFAQREAAEIAQSMEDALRSFGPHKEAKGVRKAYQFILSEQMDARFPGDMTVQGVNNIRRFLNDRWASASTPTEKEMWNRIRNAYDDKLDELITRGEQAPRLTEGKKVGRKSDSKEVTERVNWREYEEPRGAEPNPYASRVDMDNRGAGIDQLRNAVKATARLKRITNGKIRTRGGDYVPTTLSKLIKKMDSGQSIDQALRTTVGKNNDTWKQLLKDADESFDDVGKQEIRESLKSLAMRDAVFSKMRSQGIESAASMELKGEGRAAVMNLANSIDDFVDNWSIARRGDGLFSDAELQELKTFASAIRKLQTPRDVKDIALDMGLIYAGTREVGRLPSWAGSAGRGLNKNVAPYFAEGKLEKQIGFEDGYGVRLGERQDFRAKSEAMKDFGMKLEEWLSGPGVSGAVGGTGIGIAAPPSDEESVLRRARGQ